MKQVKLLLLIIACINIFAACKKDKTEPTELSKLPAATQTGANTFGCLVNGKAWVAQTDCKFLCNSPFKVFYDGSLGGNLSIFAKIELGTNNVNQQIAISFDSTNYKTIYNYGNNANIKFAFQDFLNQSLCSDVRSTDTNVLVNGKIILTRYDLPNGIFSGTFEFTLTKPSCETISVTDGRFDKKL